MRDPVGPTEAIKNYVGELRQARKMFASGEHMAAFMIMSKATGHLAEHLDVENEDLGAPAIALCSDLFSLYYGQQTEYLRQHTSVGRGGRRMPIALQALQAEAAYVMDQLMRSGLSKDETAKAAAETMERAGYRFERRNSNSVSAVMYWYEQCTGGAAHDQLSVMLFKRLRDKSTSPMPVDREIHRQSLLQQLAEQTRIFVRREQSVDPDGVADEEGEKRDA